MHTPVSVQVLLSTMYLGQRSNLDYILAFTLCILSLTKCTSGNETYADWVVKAWDWMTAIGLIGGHLGHQVFDGSNALINCTSVDHTLWS